MAFQHARQPYLYTSPVRHNEVLQQLGKHKTGAGCIYINKLADVDTKVPAQIIDASLDMDFSPT